MTSSVYSRRGGDGLLPASLLLSPGRMSLETRPDDLPHSVVQQFAARATNVRRRITSVQRLAGGGMSSPVVDVRQTVTPPYCGCQYHNTIYCDQIFTIGVPGLRAGKRLLKNRLSNLVPVSGSFNAHSRCSHVDFCGLRGKRSFITEARRARKNLISHRPKTGREPGAQTLESADTCQLLYNRFCFGDSLVSPVRAETRQKRRG